MMGRGGEGGFGTDTFQVEVLNITAAIFSMSFARESDTKQHRKLTYMKKKVKGAIVLLFSRWLELQGNNLTKMLPIFLHM